MVELIHQTGFDPEIILGLSRGGLVPGVILSHLLEVPLITASYSSKQGMGERDYTNTLPIIADMRILIVDEIADSGNTLHEVVSFYNRLRENTVRTAVVHYKQQQCVKIIPNYVGIFIPEDAPFVYYPWEKD
jgi:hypothetical protein